MLYRMYFRITAQVRLMRYARAMYEALREIKAYDRDKLTLPERPPNGDDYNAVTAIALGTLDDVEQARVPWNRIDPMFERESPLSAALHGHARE